MEADVYNLLWFTCYLSILALALSRRTAVVLDTIFFFILLCIHLLWKHVFVSWWQKKKDRWDEHNTFTSVKPKASHKPCYFLNRWKEKGAERSNYYLLCSCCFHGLFYVPSERLFPRCARRTGRTQSHSRPLPSAIMAMIQSLQGNTLPQHTEIGEKKEKKNVLGSSLLMELKAKGVSAQRGDHQPLHLRSSSSQPHLTIWSPPAVISKCLPFCACSLRKSS